MDLDLRCLTVSLMMPEAVELSVCMCIGPYGCPISSSEVLITSHSLVLMNRPPNSASAAEAIKFFRMDATTNIAPLCLVCDVGLNLSLRKKPPHPDSCLGFRQVICITVNTQLYLACTISNLGVTMGVTIFHKCFGGLHGRLGALGLC